MDAYAVGASSGRLGDFVEYSKNAGGEAFENLGHITRKLYDDIPLRYRSQCHGKCVEPRILSKMELASKAKNLEEFMKYAKDTLIAVKNSNRGEVPACASCKIVLDKLGIRDIFSHLRD